MIVALCNFRKDGFVVSIIRFKFQRKEALRFLSHLDQLRLFQRAFRRASIEIEHSQGFNPHPKLAFAQAMSVGMVSDEEYADVTVKGTITIDEFMQKINEALPEGLCVVDAWYIEKGTLSLNASMAESEYEINVDLLHAVSEEAIQKAVDTLLAKQAIIIQRRTKKGKIKEKDIRPFIKALEIKKIEALSITFGLTVIYIEQQCVKPMIVLEKLGLEGLILDPTVFMVRKKLKLT